MTEKTAIFDEKEQAALLGSCTSDREFIPIWLMLRCGMHPNDISRAREKLSIQAGLLMWKRSKNARARRERVPPDILPRLQNWLKHCPKLTRIGYNQLVHRVGARMGHPEHSPLTLRHTFGLQELRRFMSQEKPPPDFIALVAVKMGCRRETVMQYYIDLDQWEKLGEGKEKD